MAIQSITTVSNWTIATTSTGNSALAVGATITFPYPTGYTQGNFQPGGEVLSVPSMSIVVSALPCQYTSSGIVATNNSSLTIPANTTLRLQTGGIVTSSAPAAPVQPTVPVITQAFGLDPTKLLNWIVARSRVKAGVGRARIVCMGDSTTSGIGATDFNGRYQQSYPKIMSDTLTTFGVQGSYKSFMGSQNISEATYPTFNPQVVIGAGWANAIIAESIGGPMLTNTTTTNSVDFTPSGNIDSFELYLVKNGGLGTISWAIDAGGTTNISTNNTPEGIQRTATLSAGAAGTHTIKVARVSASCYYIGCVAWDSTVPGVDVINAGRGSGRTTELIGSSRGWTPLANVVGTLTPDLVIVNVGINDYTNQSNSVAQYKANLQVIAANWKTSTTDLLFVWPTPTASSRQTLIIQAQYQQAMYDVANQYGVPIVDLTTRWQSYSQQPSAMYADTVHPSRQGYADIGSYIGSLLATV